MCDSRVIEKCCGTCRRWEPDKITWLRTDNPIVINSLGQELYGVRLQKVGKCRLDGKERKAWDMSGCLGWKEAEPWELGMRGGEQE